MKILQIISRLNIGGASIYCILLASELQRRGHDVLLVKGKAAEAEGEMTDVLDPAAFDFRQIQIAELGREINPINDLKSLFKMLRLFLREKPDIVHTHTSKAGFIGRCAALLTRVPVIIHSSHGTIFSGYFSSWKAKLFIFFEKWLGHRTHCLFTDTESVRLELIENDIAPLNRLQVLPIGIKVEDFSDLSPYDGFLRNKLGLGKDILLVGTVARLVPIKGIDLFLKAAVETASLFPKVHFVVVGDGELRKELEEQAARSGISEKITFLGFWKDLREIYADLDVIVLSSLNEGCPVSILEGMASQKPVVATNVGGVPDVIKNGETGLLVSRDAVALSEAVLSLLQNEELRNRLAVNGLRFVQKEFSIMESVRKTEEKYKDLFISKAKD